LDVKSQPVSFLAVRAENGGALGDFSFVQRLAADGARLTGTAIDFHFFAVTAGFAV
jgi:hypothetical protein